MIESATEWGRKTLERARDKGDGVATEVRERVDPRVTAPLLAVAGFVGAIGEFFLDPQSGSRRRAATRDRIATLIRRNRGTDGKTSGDGATSKADGYGRGKAERQAAIRSK